MVATRQCLRLACLAAAVVVAGSSALVSRASDLQLTRPRAGAKSRRAHPRMMPRAAPKVPYKVPNSEFFQWVGVYERMARERILFLRSGLDDGVVNGMIATLLYLENEDRSSPVQLYVNVPGSLTKSGLALLDTMRTVAFPIATLNLGMAADMGAFIVAAGDKGKRSTLPHARFVVCAPAMRGVPGEQPPPMQAEDIGREVGEVLRDRARIAAALAELTGQTEEAVMKVLKRNTYFDAQEAKDFGLVDLIVAPKVSSRASSDADFGFGNFGPNAVAGVGAGAVSGTSGPASGDEYTPQLG
mmetsp:Transcript_12724/g.33197  ORF Transcript_12724/g.33197 Transcript_12724/m.33197 type:complete len:300 (+) Transcript_12724:64-963(+)